MTSRKRYRRILNSSLEGLVHGWRKVQILGSCRRGPGQGPQPLLLRTWTTRYSRRARRETSEPRPPPPVCRTRQVSLGVSERRACKVLEQPRWTQGHEPLVRGGEQALTNDIVGYAKAPGYVRPFTTDLDQVLQTLPGQVPIPATSPGWPGCGQSQSGCLFLPVGANPSDRARSRLRKTAQWR